MMVLCQGITCVLKKMYNFIKQVKHTALVSYVVQIVKPSEKYMNMTKLTLYSGTKKAATSMPNTHFK